MAASELAQIIFEVGKIAVREGVEYLKKRQEEKKVQKIRAKKIKLDTDLFWRQYKYLERIKGPYEAGRFAHWFWTREMPTYRFPWEDENAIPDTSGSHNSDK